MNYCIYDVGNNKYFCDFTEKFFDTFKDCYDNCGLTLKNGNDTILIHISNIDFTFLIGLWAVLLSALLIFAFHLSHN
jgi:hypothetical protein